MAATCTRAMVAVVTAPGFCTQLAVPNRSQPGPNGSEARM